MTRVEEKLLEHGYEGVIFLENYSYEDALIGVTEDQRAVYDYEKMIKWLIEKKDFSEEEATDWISYNTIQAISYMGESAPVIMYPFKED